MANNYTSTSSFIGIPKDKIEQARVIVGRVDDEMGDDPDCGCAQYTVDVEPDGVWIYSEESCDPEHIEVLVRALVEELDLPDIVVCSWAYTCSKPRIDEFGGGAFAVQKGIDTVWVDAAGRALEMARSAREEFKQQNK